MATFWLLLRRFTRALWFLPALFSVSAVGVVTIAFFSQQLLPASIGRQELPLTISVEAVRSILSIIASSMLAVTVFALSTLVTLRTTAAQTGSPRAVPLIVGDRAAQTSISVFIGAFLFSIVGIIGLSGDFYGPAGRLVMFVATIFVVFAVIWALLRWIREISVLGRIDETIGRTEEATRIALRRAGAGALYSCSPRRTVPAGACAVRAVDIGFIQHFDPECLQEAASSNNLSIHVVGRPGSYVDFGSVLAWAEGDINDELRDELRSSFLIDSERSFEYDAGYGLVVLADIARRALSPAVNDPNTAIHVITIQTRLLADWARDNRAHTVESKCDRVTLVPIEPAALLAEAYRDIARDAAASIDVTLAVLRALHSLSVAKPEDLAGAASNLAAEIAERAETSMQHPPDLVNVRKQAEKLKQHTL